MAGFIDISHLIFGQDIFCWLNDIMAGSIDLLATKYFANKYFAGGRISWLALLISHILYLASHSSSHPIKSKFAGTIEVRP